MQALLHQCRAADFIVTPQQMLPSMLAKVSAVTDSANTVFTFIRSQLPYSYVHLVSFTVHFFVFFWATYIGAFLHAGIPNGFVSQTGLLNLDDPDISPSTASVRPFLVPVRGC